MTGLDIALVALLALSAYSGWRAGALSMILSIVILAIAGVMASSFAVAAGNMLRVGPAFSRPVVGFIFTFIVLIILGALLRRVIKPKRGLLRGLDAIVGLVLGLVRGVFLLSVLLVLLRLVHLPSESMRRNSRVYPPLLKTSTLVVGVLRPYVNSTTVALAAVTQLPHLLSE